MEQRTPDRDTHAPWAHLDADALALLAIGEAPAGEAESQHLGECAACRAEFDALSGAASVARTTLGQGALVSPPSSVWAGIQRELGLPADLRPGPPAPLPAVLASVPSPAVLGEGESAAERPSPVSDLADARARRSRRRRLVAPLVGVAAAAALVTTVALSWDALRPAPPVTLASASLDALPAWAGASGEAVVLERPDGERVVSITVADAAEAEGVREVWLLTPEVDGLISLGLLEGDSGEFAIPAGIDLGEYPIVDVSLEPVDGDPAHSGDSIVRGALDV